MRRVTCRDAHGVHVKAIVRRSLCSSLLMALLVLSACQAAGSSQPTTPMTTSELRAYTRAWLTSARCPRPCWDGILPGASTIDDVSMAAAMNPATESTSTPYPGEWNWSFSNYQLSVNAQYELSARRTISNLKISLETGYRPIVDPAHRGPGEWRYMRFERLRPVEESPLVTVGEVVAKLGPPDYVAAWIYTGRTGPSHYLVYVYAHDGVALKVEDIPGTVPDAGPGAVVAHLTFFVPGLENYVATRGFPNAPFSLSAPPMPWSGFIGFAAYCQNVAPTTTPCDVKPR